MGQIILVLFEASFFRWWRNCSSSNFGTAASRLIQLRNTRPL